jgi:PII-like signaling protein/nucleotide-binding universal stress UspA family protein
MFDRMLILVDGSPGDRLAVDYGVNLARAVGGSAHIVGVLELPMVSPTIDEVRDREDEGRYRLEQALRDARGVAESVGQPITTEIVIGNPVDAASRVIKAREINLVVLGETHESLNRDRRALARKLPCPVFVAQESVVQEFVGAPENRTEHWEVRRDRRVRIEGSGTMLQVFVGERDRHEGRPLYEVIVERFRQLDLAGATVFPGHLGFGATGRVHAAHRPWSHDCPIVITVVDTDEAIQRAIDGAADLVTNGMIVTSPVQVIKYAHGPASHRVGVEPSQASSPHA